MPRTVLRRCAAALGVAAAALIAGAPSAGAHPLGNFTVNQSTTVVVEADAVEVVHVIDLAEIPTFQARSGADTDGDETISESEANAYARTTCERAAKAIDLTADGAALQLSARTSDAAFLEGQAGLLTTRVTCTLDGDIELEGDTAFELRNAGFGDRVGWREIVVAGDRTTITDSTAPPTSSTNQLRTYPKNARTSPPDERTASFRAVPGGPALARHDSSRAGSASTGGRGIDGATRAFQDFVGRTDLTPPVAIIAVLFAMLLGAIHAFAPGHGKTVMAAYLVGRRGSLKQASVIALTVTATHTAGVLLLGVLVSASAVVAPERLYPWLGAISGVLLLMIGVSMLRVSRPRAVDALLEHDDHDHDQHDHDHDHDHDHEHDHPHEHEHAPAPTLLAAHRHGSRWHTHAPPPDPSLRPAGLLAMGFVGGLLPSPSALVVLLGAIALHRAWFGVILVTAYGAGMALTLTGAGLLLVRGRAAIDRHLQIGRRLPALLALERRLPMLTGAVVIVVGIVLAANGLRSIA